MSTATAQVIRCRGRRSNEISGRFFGTSLAIVRADRLRAAAAECCDRVLRRPAKQLRPFVSPQAASDLRKSGGAVGAVAVLMLADPDAAGAIAAHLQAVADTVTEQIGRPMPETSEQAIRAAADLLLAMDRAERAPNDRAALAGFCAATEDLIAALRLTLAAARRHLHELERTN